MTTSSPITKFFLVAVIALLTLQVVSADLRIAKYEHDATFDSAFQQTRACSCGTTTDYFTLENHGDFPATYRFTLQAEVDWITLHRSTVTLDPEERTLIPITLAPPCGEDEVTSYQVYATSEFGRYRVADRTVTAHTCENVALEVVPSVQQTLPCSDAGFDVTVRNTGTFDERYVISADDPAVALEETFVRLAPGEHRTLTANAVWACSEWGRKDVEFTAHAQRNDQQYTAQASVEILWDYDFLVDTVEEDAANVCAEITTERRIAITNTAGQQNSYALSEDSPFAQLRRSDVTIAPGATEIVTLEISPAESHVGSHDVTVEVEAAVGGASHEVSIPVSVRDCFEHEVNIMPQRPVVCAGDINYTVQIVNRGEAEESFTATTQGDIFSEITPTTKTLRPGEHDNRLLHVVVPDRTEEYTVSVHVQQSPGVSSVTDLPINAVSNARCTEPSVSSTELELYTDTKGVPFIIENTGFEATTYRLGWEGNAFTITEDEVFLAPGEQAVVHIVPASDTTLEEGEIVERFVLTSHRSTYRHDFVIDLEDKGLFTRGYLAIFGGEHVDWCLLLIVILFIIAVILALWLLLILFGVLEPIQMIESEQRSWTFVLVVLAVGFLLLAVLAGVYAQPQIQVIDEPRGSNASALYHETLMNEDILIDLSQYFSDPDEDSLNFTASQPEHARVIIQGDSALIVPERNWAGQESIVFTASDNESSVDSPIMTVRVLATRSAGLGSFIKAYCWMFNALLAALILLLIIGLIRVRPDETLKERYGQPVRDVIVAEPLYPAEQRPATTQAPGGQTMVGGDVVAGDKVTIHGKQPRELWVASTGGKKVHRSDCVVAQRIPKEKRVVIEGKKQALEEGYAGCNLCQPFDE